MGISVLLETRWSAEIFVIVADSTADLVATFGTKEQAFRSQANGALIASHQYTVHIDHQGASK